MYYKWKVKNAIKWVQSQAACLNFAERKHFGRKPKVKSENFIQNDNQNSKWYGEKEYLLDIDARFTEYDCFGSNQFHGANDIVFDA